MRKQVYSLLVENNPGVTSRISGLFSRRGYNIDSFSSGVTADPRYTRITIVATGDEQILEQIEKQVAKLVDVRNIKELKPEDSVYRELALIKVKATADDRQGIMTICDIFRAKVIDVSSGSIMMELTGAQSKIDAFLNMVENYEILELARTGIAGLGRGHEDIVYIED